MLFSFIFLYVLELVMSYDLSVLHVNDIHVHMDEVNKWSSTCKDGDKRAGKCYGGVSRIHSLAKELREDGNTLWLNAGDFFQGTVWYTQFKWRVVSKFNRMLDFDAITLGNHEFDDNIAGILPFLKEQTAPVVVTNFNHSLVPEFAGLYVKSTVKEIGGRKVGIVGYLTPHTRDISNPGKLIFLDEIESLTQEVKRLEDSGVDIIVALGHSGYETDLEVARSVPGIDVVVGGHSHSFLYSPTDKKRNPSVNKIIGPYPTIVNRTDGSSVAVVQAFAFTKYLGKLDLQFSDDGRLVSWEGEPILLDNSVPKDGDMERELEPFREELNAIQTLVIGSTTVDLLPNRTRESALGSLVSDIMVWSYRHKQNSGERVHLAFTNSGGIRGSFEKGNITKGDLLGAFPFQNSYDLLTLKGSTILKAMEHSATVIGAIQNTGRFLQYSGFRVMYDPSAPEGARLVKAEAVNADGIYEKIRAEAEYRVVTTNYVAGGGDGYYMLKNENLKHEQGMLDTDIIEAYLKQYSPISAKLKGRIILVPAPVSNSGLQLRFCGLLAVLFLFM